MYNFDEIINRRGTDSIKWDMVKEDTIPMWVADMDFKCPPEVIEVLKNRVEHGVYGYSECFIDYHESVVNWMRKRHSWEVEKHWICPTPGIVTAINLLVRALTKPGDKVILQSPVYFPFFKAIKNNGCEIVDNTLKFDGKRYTMDFDKLEEQFDERVKLMILCSPHNPVGRVWTEEELRRLGELCIKNNVIVISDEIHSDLVWEGNKHTVFASISKEFAENCVVCTAPSKTFNIAGLQASNIIIPNKKIGELLKKELDSAGIGHLNSFAIPAVKAAYNHGEQWLDELLVYLKDNFDFLKNYLQENIPEIKVVDSEGTYLGWLDFRGLGLDDNEIEDLVKNKAKLIFNQGHTFGESGSGFQRINIGCPRSTLREGLERLKKAVKKQSI